MFPDCSIPVIQGGIHFFDARGVARRFRHAAVFGALNALHPGETMRFCNDHDPLPLLEQIGQFFGQRVRVTYVERTKEKTVIDFCVLQ
ncbi:DUF2249 domain-containing protein [Laribacter hongkongensis]|uniref:DUF2249 domain containing protein n=1 Tax=Laribacter hongkongensis TaxID=168471 RepID=A0A248LI00_9NEIS|nr:DUF2249 domain-containing protein [Laribacter hongkongensis]ASJ24377.1 DUF2249 domain containing protein [Laribacter hongkongensis]MCG9042021.1 DUF2249 domain-containing protein [Laribacter hongkongensis]MCG9053900.1 DUF2249 domain-containing protein [Laribacter hongkongensis]MCG9069057.1 DUF2249 domain-containing protein [Laribacter hongkongensis]MCG9083864.1 DUF2249 domain-containing protein [Laribacter hongkongensis]